MSDEADNLRQLSKEDLIEVLLIEREHHREMVERADKRRYLVFAGENYYPAGGTHDFWAAFAEADTAYTFAQLLIAGASCDWAHVVTFSDQCLDILAEYDSKGEKL